MLWCVSVAGPLLAKFCTTVAHCQEQVIKKRESDDHQFYMRVACLVAFRSKDRETKVKIDHKVKSENVENQQVGAVIVRNNAIIATGYNGHVQHPTESGLDVDNDRDFPWDKGNKDKLKNKDHFVVHAEHNALLNVNDRDVSGCTMYVTLHPCHDCAKLVAESGINKVVYYEERDRSTYLAAKRTFLLSQPTVQYIRYADALRDCGVPNVTKNYEKFKPEMNRLRLSWNHYFMGVAQLASRRSNDPKTKVGCCIVNERNRIVGVGYNTMPYPCDDRLDWAWDKRDLAEDQSNVHQTKYGYVLHAVNMAMLKKNSADVKGCRVYVTHYPDSDCVKSIIQSKIGEVIYMDDSRKDVETEVGRKMLKWSKIPLRQFHPKVPIKLKMLDGTVDVFAEAKGKADQ